MSSFVGQLVFSGQPARRAAGLLALLVAKPILRLAAYPHRSLFTRIDQHCFSGSYRSARYCQYTIHISSGDLHFDSTRTSLCLVAMDSLVTPVGLIGLSLCTCVHLHLVEKGGRIQLKDPGNHQNGTSVERERDEDGASIKEQDEAEDEGIPVDIEKWWLKVRLRKAALAAILAILDAAACLNLGWTASHGSHTKSDTYAIVEDACMVAFWVGLP